MPEYFRLFLRTVSVSWLCYTKRETTFFFHGEKERVGKEKRHFWQTAPQPKEALLRVMVARVILFVCAGVAVPFTLFLRSVTVSSFSARVLCLKQD